MQVAFMTYNQLSTLTESCQQVPHGGRRALLIDVLCCWSRGKKIPHLFVYNLKITLRYISPAISTHTFFGKKPDILYLA